jgi:integrase
LKLYRTVQIRGSGRWLARFSYQGQVHGSSGNTPTEAEAKRDDLLKRMVSGTQPVAPVRSTRTVSALCDLFLHAVSENPGPGVQRYGDVPVKPGTLATHVAILRRHCNAKPFPMQGGRATEAGKRFGSLLVSEVKPSDVKRLLDAMRDNGYCANTRQRLHGTLIQVFQYGTQIGWLRGDSDGYRSAVQATVRPKGEKAKRMSLTASEARILLDTARASDSRWADAVEILVRTGLRRSEILGLTWGKVRLDEDGSGGWLLINAGLHREAERLGSRSRLVLTTVKTASSNREVRLTPESVLALVRQCERQAAEQAAAGSRWVGGDAGSDEIPTFATIFGGWTEANVFNNGFRAIADAAGFPELTIHGVRHTFVSIAGTQMLKETGSINWQQLADMAGHSNPGVTRRVYAHLDQEVVDAVRRESWTQAGSIEI